MDPEKHRTNGDKPAELPSHYSDGAPIHYPNKDEVARARSGSSAPDYVTRVVICALAVLLFVALFFILVGGRVPPTGEKYGTEFYYKQRSPDAY